VKGNIRCARIVMEDGAQFSGKIEMGQNKKPASKPASLTVAESAKQAELAG
jgi:cytoskeletal protein CcmA (bactofilin family)